MEFRTRVDIPVSKTKIDHTTGILLIGSCFADNIGSKLKELKFRVEHNPFGVLYNPASVKNDLELLMDKKTFSESDLYWYNDRWISFSHYSLFSDPDKTKCLQKINDSINSASKVLEGAGFLFITFGTAWVYEFLKTGNIVANCHKIPSREFRRFLLRAEDIVKEYEILLPTLRTYNPDLQIVFTLSPIRHWKDGATGNQLSKSILLVAIHQLVDKYEYAHYFPAYEILMDELRDYRFYAKDMLHLSDAAIDYIWEKFMGTFVSDESAKLIKEIEKVIKARNHRPANPQSADYRKFKETVREQINEMLRKYPGLDLAEELAFFS